MNHREMHIPVGAHTLAAEFVIPDDATGLVVFAHGSGSSRSSPRNQWVAEISRAAGLGTLLFDLLTPGEEARDVATAEFRFDIGFLAERLVTATQWVHKKMPALRVGYFGTSTGAAAALLAAAETHHTIGAIVTCRGRPDLASDSLAGVHVPTLLVVGASDDAVVQLNQEAYERLACEKQITIVPGASHLFEEPGTLEQIARLTVDWFHRHLRRSITERSGRIEQAEQRRPTRQAP
jgi:predicted alpha/beta-hydrolase family hydrolase